MALTPASILSAALGNFKPDASIWAGGGASVLVFLAGCIAVGMGLAIPPVSILGVHLIATSIPLTMTMVAAAAPAIGHFVSAYVSPTEKQAIDVFAKKVGANADNIKAIIPLLQASAVEQFPADKNGQTDSDTQAPSQSNINKG